VFAASAALGMAGAGIANAQTVMVRSAAPGSTIEAVVDASPAASATANAAGEATITIPESAAKNDVDANIFVDICANNRRRVLIVERGHAPAAPGEGCDRKDIPGLYWIRRVSTVVVTMTEPNPRVLLRQGSFSFKPPRVFGAPRGLIVFGGGGLTTLGDIGLLACGDVLGCTHRDDGWGFTAGAEYWVTPWLAAEGTYMKPAEATASGSGDDFHFDNSFKADVFTVSGKLGVPIGRVRIYGKFGGAFHEAKFITDQTNDDRTVTLEDGTTRTVPGGLQTYRLRTEGWGWTFGGGLEVWTAPAFGLYLEAGRTQLKGNAVDEAEGSLDDHANHIMLGARIRLWGK
jgi:hypothetical protein